MTKAICVAKSSIYFLVLIFLTSTILHFLHVIVSLLTSKISDFFSLSGHCLSTFLIMSRQDFNVDEVQYVPVFSFITLLLILYLRNHCLTQDYKDIHLCFIL